jgi:hypothetical protein
MPSFEDAVEHQVADLVVVEGSVKHALGSGAEGGAALALGLVLATGDLKIGDGLVGKGADAAWGQLPLAAAVFPALRAGVFLGCGVNRYNEGYGCFGAHTCVLG